ncbi:hypothetical protein EMIT047CA2_60247 [Pseudomonas soli]
MAGSKPAALPLGDAPISAVASDWHCLADNPWQLRVSSLWNGRHFNKLFSKCKAFFLKKRRKTAS